jgi:hypothetical protein
MWTLKKIIFASALISASAVSLVLVGCGKRDVDAFGAPATPGSVPSAQNIGSCPGGQYNIGGVCTFGTTFDQACYARGGLPIITQGKTLCRIEFRYGTPWAFPAAFFPRLNPQDTAGYQAYSTGIPVRPNDKLVWKASGSWGGTSSSTYQVFGFIPFTTWTQDCDEVSINGYKEGRLLTYGNFADGRAAPAGLLGTDGTEVFVLGSSMTRRMKNAGTLKFGFNAPAGTGSCSYVSVTSLRVVHCEDAAQVSYPCE